MEIDGSSIIITGAGRGIGRAVALELARHGARVTCAARNRAQVEETAELIGRQNGQARAAALDVQDLDACQRLVRETVAEYGAVDVWIGAAGALGAIGPVWEADPEAWWNDVATNLRGSFNGARAVLPHMMERGRGVIVNFSGGGVVEPFLGASGYGSSKCAIVRLTDTLAGELEQAGQHGIFVFAMEPGFVRSAMTEAMAQSAVGRRWMPQVGRWLDTGQDHPAEDVGRAMVKLLRIARRELNGRLITWSDDFEAMERDAGEIRARDGYQLRVRK